MDPESVRPDGADEVKAIIQLMTQKQTTGPWLAKIKTNPQNCLQLGPCRSLRKRVLLILLLEKRCVVLRRGGLKGREKKWGSSLRMVGMLRNGICVVWICLTQGVALLGGVALLEEVCHCWGGLWDLPPSFLEVSFLLSAFGSRHRTFSSSSLSSAWMLPHPRLDDNGMNLWTCKPVPIKCWLLHLVMVSVHSNGTLTKTAGECSNTPKPSVHNY